MFRFLLGLILGTVITVSFYNRDKIDFDGEAGVDAIKEFLSESLKAE